MKIKLGILKNILFLLLGVLILVFLFRKQDLGKLFNEFLYVNYWWILVGKICTILAHWLRSERWRMMLAPVAKKPTSLNAFTAVMSGYFANLAIPRLGEFVRCGALKKTEKISYDKLLGTVIGERAVDAILLVLLTLILVFLRINLLGDFFYNNLVSVVTDKLSIQSIVVIIGGIVVLGVALLIFLKKKNSPLLQKVSNSIEGLKEGLLSVFKLKKGTALFFVISILIWLLYTLSIFFCFKGINQTVNVNLWDSFLVLIFSGLAMLAPVQGGIGAYHWMVMQGLVIIGFSSEVGLTVATIIHASKIAMLILVGGASTLYIAFQNAEDNLKEG